MTRLTAAGKRYLRECIILVDSREQTPWTFTNHETREAKLGNEYPHLFVGDYSIAHPSSEEFPDARSWAPGEADGVFVERKTLPDLIGSISQGRERFGREWVKAHELNVKGNGRNMVVECTWGVIFAGDYRSKMSVASIVQTLVTWPRTFGFHLDILGDQPNCEGCENRCNAMGSIQTDAKRQEMNRKLAARMAESILEKHVARILKREGM